MSECTHDCSSCGQNCASRTEPQSFLKSLNPYSSVKKVIAVVSGKGGVGKSLVTSLLASEMQRSFGITRKAMGTDEFLIPVTTESGMQIMSINLILEDDTAPVVWRGPVIAGAVTQFWTDVLWQDVDYMFVDMPPGTGDVPLTVFQSLPIDGVVIVTTPQDLVGMIVAKAVNMAEMMKIPVLGIVENMSYFQCPDCGEKHEIFGDSKVEQEARDFNIPHFVRLPIDPVVAAMVDAGEVESAPVEEIKPMVDAIEEEVKL